MGVGGSSSVTILIAFPFCARLGWRCAGCFVDVADGLEVAGNISVWCSRFTVGHHHHHRTIIEGRKLIRFYLKRTEEIHEPLANVVALE